MDVNFQRESPLQSAHRPYEFVVVFLNVFFVNAVLCSDIYATRNNAPSSLN